MGVAELGLGGVAVVLGRAVGCAIVFGAEVAADVAGLTLLVVAAFGDVPTGEVDALSSGAGDEVGSRGIGVALGTALAVTLVLGAAVASPVPCVARIIKAPATMAMSAPRAKIARTKNQTLLDLFLCSGSPLRANCAGAVGIAGGGAESCIGVCGGAVPAGTVAPNADAGAPGIGAMINASRSSIMGIAIACEPGRCEYGGSTAANGAVTFCDGGTAAGPTTRVGALMESACIAACPWDTSVPESALMAGATIS